MPNKKILIGLVFLISIFSLAIISAQSSFCCEKTLDTDPIGDNSVFCQNAPQDQCDDSYRSVPTSCEATSYCKKGTCVNTEEGICLENTPRVTCEEQEEIVEGAWYDTPSDEVPLCQLGCCLIGDQAAFVTQTRCQKLSSFYGLNINFQANIQNEIECIAMATPEAKGACVLETQTGRTCRFVTKKECKEIPGDFHQGMLCSNPDLGADCGATKRTTCVEGRDEVYFIDSCGNLANVYDASKVEDTEYWSEIQAPTCDLTLGQGGNAATCGDCNYYLGSTCGEYRTGVDTKPQVGNYVCRDLNCKYEKVEYNHGETWCGRITGNVLQLGNNPGVTAEKISEFDKSRNNPGSRDFRFVCYNGEVTIEPCADFRQEVCLQSSVGGFKAASCRANLWLDCYEQDNQEDCENEDKRDCKWIIGRSILKNEGGESLAKDENGNAIEASCVPLYPPGFDFWKEGSAKDICSKATTTCIVRYESRKIFGEEKWNITESREGILGRLGYPGKKTEEVVCLDNEGNIVEDWKIEIKNTCSALGDCGIDVNYIGGEGYYRDDNLFTKTGKLGE